MMHPQGVFLNGELYRFFPDRMSEAYPDVDETKAFLVPKGTLVRIATAIWYLVPLPANEESLTAMIVLPETTYARDCPVIDLREEDIFKMIR